MFKVKLLLYVLVVSSTNLFAAKSAILEKKLAASGKDGVERVAGAKRKRKSEPVPVDIYISLTKFMSEEEVAEVVRSGTYSYDQLRNALGIFLYENCKQFPEKRISKIEECFTKKSLVNQKMALHRNHKLMTL